MVVLPFVSLFVFPWSLTRVFMLAAGLVYPPIALIVGALSDILYHPGFGWPMGLVWGVVLAALAAIVRHVVKTRVM